MALPYPEGEVFFKRSVLKDNDNGLDPDNLTSFNQHALIEWCWNETPDGVGYSRSRVEHPFGIYNKKETFAYYNAMIIMFGTGEGFEKGIGMGDARHYSRHSGIKRMVKTELPSGSEEYEKRAKCGPLKTALTPIKLDPDQPYMQGVRMWDLPINESKEKREKREANKQKALKTLKSDKLYPSLRVDLEAFLVQNELEQSGVRMDFDLHAGLGLHSSHMLSLYIPGIYNHLILPRQMRSVERGLYMPIDPTKSLIRIHAIDAINSSSKFIDPATTTQKLCLKLDMTKILEGNLGIQVVWQPFDIPKPEDANKMLVDVVEAGLFFVPVVGPLASNCFGLFMDIVNNPEAFKNVNPFGLSGSLLADAASAAEAIADGLPKYSKAGKMAGFFSKAGGAFTKFA